MPVKVKICGITNFDDAQYAAEAGASALGFIFYDHSPRSIEPEQAGRIIRSLSGEIMTVGVFVNCNRSTVVDIVRQTGIQALQFSGDEKPADCLGYDRPVIKAFRMRTMNDIGQLRDYALSAILLDGYKEGMYGGTGEIVDPEIAKVAGQYHPLILAGGLTPENFEEPVLAIRPFAIDLNSGLEQSPGKKDFKKISLLFRKLQDLHTDY